MFTICHTNGIMSHLQIPGGQQRMQGI